MYAQHEGLGNIYSHGELGEKEESLAQEESR